MRSDSILTCKHFSQQTFRSSSNRADQAERLCGHLLARNGTRQEIKRMKYFLLLVVSPISFFV